ncbi:Protein DETOXIFICATION 47 [Mactra antiquata]
MRIQENKRFKSKDSMAMVVFYAIICLCIIVYMCTQEIGVSFEINKDVEDEVKNKFLTDGDLFRFNLIPCRREYYVYPVNELPEPNLPRIGQNDGQSRNEDDRDGIVEEPLRYPHYQTYHERLSSFSNGPHDNPSHQVLSDAESQTPRLESFEARLHSYEKWPIPECQNPRKLAEAGFYYTGYGDLVKCFHCGGGLRNWEYLDVPWVEHCRFFPECPYANDMRGTAYIAPIPEENRLFPNDATILNDPLNYLDIHQSMMQPNAQALDKQPEEEKDIDAIVEENENMKRKFKCVICRENNIRIVTLPCAHFVLCMTCAEEREDCPKCKKAIKVKHKTYPS